MTIICLMRPSDGFRGGKSVQGSRYIDLFQ